MTKLVECIPNFSEGRNRSVIEGLAGVAGRAPGVSLLDYSSDVNHNRSVFTLLGGPDHLAEAAFLLCKSACGRIDMTMHKGEHPCIGATDVIPFVPIRGCTMAECVDISRQVARRIYEELKIPCFLYGEACTSEPRRNLANIRRGGFAGMPRKLLDEAWAPDFGERRIHPTAGVTAVGARKLLIAFNVNLCTSDVGVAKRIAKTVRESNGGLKDCKAIGVELADRGIVQVSMNLTDFEVTPIYRAFEAIRAEAARAGVEVAGSELIGLAPAKALIDCAEHFMKIENFSYKTQVLENHLME